MDILAGVKDKLRFIERFYAAASEPFAETKRRIEACEAPYSGPSDPECWDGEPPFLDEWIEADEAVNLVGQAALSLVQSAFREYLDGFIRLSQQQAPAGRGNWFGRYKKFFLGVYGIDWEGAPVSPSALEEINLARNDSQHSGQEFGMTRHMSGEHHSRFPDGLFAGEIDKAISHEYHSGDFRPRIYVTRENLQEAIRRVETFCEFLDQKLRSPPS